MGSNMSPLILYVYVHIEYILVRDPGDTDGEFLELLQHRASLCAQAAKFRRLVASRLAPTMAPKKKMIIPPESRNTARRSTKPIARFGAADSDDSDDDMPLGQMRVKAAEGGLTQGSKMERCRAALDLMQLRPDAFWFTNPVNLDDVPDYLDIIDSPSVQPWPRMRLDAGNRLATPTFSAARAHLQAITLPSRPTWRPTDMV